MAQPSGLWEQEIDDRQKTPIASGMTRMLRRAAHFYAATFPDSAVHAVRRAPGDFPGGKAGDVDKRAFAAMITMHKIDVAVIEAAIRGH
jgi:predicted 3-demethylubiquinone-9 3-methyltransferase (glyoxalase superfamily)